MGVTFVDCGPLNDKMDLSCFSSSLYPLWVDSKRDELKIFVCHDWKHYIMKHIYLIMNRKPWRTIWNRYRYPGKWRMTGRGWVIALTIVELEFAWRKSKFGYIWCYRKGSRSLRIPEIPSLKYKWEFERYYRNCCLFDFFYMWMSNDLIFFIWIYL